MQLWFWNQETLFCIFIGIWFTLQYNFEQTNMQSLRKHYFLTDNESMVKQNDRLGSWDLSFCSTPKQKSPINFVYLHITDQDMRYWTRFPYLWGQLGVFVLWFCSQKNFNCGDSCTSYRITFQIWQFYLKKLKSGWKFQLQIFLSKT